MHDGARLLRTILALAAAQNHVLRLRPLRVLRSRRVDCSTDRTLDVTFLEFLDQPVHLRLGADEVELLREELLAIDDLTAIFADDELRLREVSRCSEIDFGICRLQQNVVLVHSVTQLYQLTIVLTSPKLLLTPAILVIPLVSRCLGCQLCDGDEAEFADLVLLVELAACFADCLTFAVLAQVVIVHMLVRNAFLEH